MERVIQPYRVGDPCGTGQTINAVLGQSETAAVYTTTDHHLRWNYRANDGRVPKELLPAISTFDSLMADIKAIVPAPHRGAAFTRLGKALFAALDGSDHSLIDSAFEPVRKFVHEMCLQHARFHYTVAFLLFSTLLVTITGIAIQGLQNLPSSNEMLLIGGFWGMIGSVISVLQRSRSLELDPRSDLKLLRMQGAARGLLGFLFGVFVVLAVHGELVLGILRDHPDALLPIAVVAGFSERLVPEIMRKLEVSL